jgi:hypothetical protein
MLNVLNKRWLSKGWRAMEPKDSEAMALVWIEELDRHRIPHDQYDTLFRRSLDLRARRMEQGKDCDDFSVDMMVACWPSLAGELERERIASGKYLPDAVARDCERCYGTGMERVFDGEVFKGLRPGCKHDAI